MTDYYRLVARAVAGLENSTADSRRELYDQVRTTQAAELASFDPALSESERLRESLALEEAISKVDADIAGIEFSKAEVLGGRSEHNSQRSGGVRTWSGPTEILRKFWWGQYSLPKSFWAFFVGGYFLCWILIMIAVALFAGVFPDHSLSRPLITLLSAVVGIIYPFWAGMGVWRSADRTAKEWRRVQQSALPSARGLPRLSVYLYKGVVLLFLGSMLFRLANGGALALMEAITAR
jgi:hypothetical protein